MMILLIFPDAVLIPHPDPALPAAGYVFVK
jgi:hypothetical protein